MRLAIIGGGGFRVPLVIRALAADPASVIDEVVLHDVDPLRLAVIRSVIGRDLGRLTVSVTSSLPEAITGSDFIFSAIRVGGAAGRVRDERRALRLGLLGQETVGAGGLAYGLRTVAIADQIARTVVELAPHAWVINFTNPAGMITEAMRGVLGERVIGICDSPIGLVNRACRALQIDPGSLDQIDYIGINHLGWLRSLVVDGVDLLPGLLGSDELLARTEEGRLFGAALLRLLHVVPNEYLYYYYRSAEVIETLQHADATRGELLLSQQAEFYDASSRAFSTAPQLWEQTRLQREQGYLAEARDVEEARDESDLEGGGYEHVALSVMGALAGGPAQTLIVNVANDGALPQLPDDLVLELPAVIDGAGAHPLPVPAIPLEQLGLIASVRAAERAVIEAVHTHSRAAAVRAFAIHPLVANYSLAERLVESIVDDEPTVAALLTSA